MSARGGVLLRLAAVALLGLAWLTSSHPVALYDGIGFPDEPYRYVVAPAGSPAAPPPAIVEFTTTAGNGSSTGDVYVASGENGPQVQMLLPSGSIATPAGASSITVTATPLAADSQPAGSTIEGNVYRIAANADVDGSLRITADSDVIALRATSPDQPGPSMVFRPEGSTSWQAVETGRNGQDVYGAAMTGFGDYALATTSAGDVGATAVTDPGSSTGRWWLVALGLVLVACVLAIRVARRRAGGAR